MIKLKILAYVLLLVILFGCAPIIVTPSHAPVSTNAALVVSMAAVQSLEVQIVGSERLQVNALLRGQLPDGGCTTISSIDQVRDGNTFNIKLMTTTDPVAICILATTPIPAGRSPITNSNV